MDAALTKPNIAPEALTKLSYRKPIISQEGLLPRIFVTDVTRETLRDLAARTKNDAIKETLAHIPVLLRDTRLMSPAARISEATVSSAFSAFLLANPAIAGTGPIRAVALSSGDLWIAFERGIEIPAQRLGITPVLNTATLLGFRISPVGNLSWDICDSIIINPPGLSLKWRDLKGYQREVVIRAAPDAALMQESRTNSYDQRGGEAVVVDARTLIQGQPLTFECPFSWSEVPGHGRVLTNGNIHLPLERPNTRQDGFPSEIRFAQGVSTADWKFFLRAVKGCYLDAVLPPLGAGFDLSIIKERIRAIKSGKTPERDDADTPSLNVECFVPPPGQNTHIDIGENIIFLLERQEGQPFYLVDAPRTCALYIFQSRSDAVAWATRSISFSAARARCCYWFPHIAGWQKEVSEWLTAQRVRGY